MIRGVHAMFYSPEPEQLRSFFRDKLGFPYTDIGDGWLIFDAPEVEIGCHPSERRFHSLSFYCDNLARTVAELKKRGVEFTSPVTEEEWGVLTHFKLPDGDEVQLYQPKYPKTNTGNREDESATKRQVKA